MSPIDRKEFNMIKKFNNDTEDKIITFTDLLGLFEKHKGNLHQNIMFSN